MCKIAGLIKLTEEVCVMISQDVVVNKIFISWDKTGTL